jgi:hypothetical protein
LSRDPKNLQAAQQAANFAQLHSTFGLAAALAEYVNPADHGMGHRPHPQHLEVTMNHIHRIRRAIRFLAALGGALLAVGIASPAFAAGLRPPPGSLYRPPAPPVTRTHTMVVGGMPGWQIALIAVSAAVLAAALAVILDRARTARRQLAAPSM